MHDKTFGLPRNTAAALSYVLFFVSGIFFYLLSKDTYVRFHAIQSVLVFGIFFFLQWLFMITVVLAPISSLIGLLSFILWLLLIYKAWKGEEWELPLIGEYAKHLAKK